MDSPGLYPACAAGGSFGDDPFFLSMKFNHPRAFSSRKMLRRKIPEMVKRMRLIKRPSTEVSDFVMTIHAIPASGIRASKMDNRSITGSKTPP
jgi:hypothetical protein